PSRTTLARRTCVGTRRRTVCTPPQEPRPCRASDPRRLGAGSADLTAGPRPARNRRRSPRPQLDDCDQSAPRRSLARGDVLDRLVHTAHRLALDGETLRKPPEKAPKRGKLDTAPPEGALKPFTGPR